MVSVLACKGVSVVFSLTLSKELTLELVKLKIRGEDEGEGEGGEDSNIVETFYMIAT